MSWHGLGASFTRRKCETESYWKRKTWKVFLAARFGNAARRGSNRFFCGLNWFSYGTDLSLAFSCASEPNRLTKPLRFLFGRFSVLPNIDFTLLFIVNTVRRIETVSHTTCRKLKRKKFEVLNLCTLQCKFEWASEIWNGWLAGF